MNSLLIKTEVCGWLPTQLKCKEKVLLILIQVIPACLGQRDVVHVAKCRLSLAHSLHTEHRLSLSYNMHKNACNSKPTISL